MSAGKRSASGKTRRSVASTPTRNLHGHVVHELGQRIVGGELRPGELLPREETLADQMEVSRTQVHLISQASDVSLSFLVDEDRAADLVRRLHTSLIELRDEEGRARLR